MDLKESAKRNRSSIQLEKGRWLWHATYPVVEAERSWAMCSGRSREKVIAKAQRQAAKSQERAERWEANRSSIPVK